MKSLDKKYNRSELKEQLMEKLKAGDETGFADVFDKMCTCIGDELQEEFNERINEVKEECDSRVLASRGVRQLTGEEKQYYQKVAEAMKSRDPKQELANLNVALPRTVIDSVFEDLRTRHELLSAINFIPSGGAVEILVNTNGQQRAVWGELCDSIITELSGGLKLINTQLLKLSAFLPVCKAMLDLGPEWLDRFVRETLYEALANGLEYGIVSGDGNNEPIGMIRDVSDNVAVVGGVYPAKSQIVVNDLRPTTIGNLLSLMAVDQHGKPRDIDRVILVVNPQDYFQKVMPATTIMAPDGTYRNDVMPYPMTIIRSSALNRGEATIGIAPRYMMFAGTAKEGRIEYSDHAQFLQDKRVYLIKAYANGLPMDNNAFLYLDISNLQPAVWRVENVTPETPSSDATLSGLTLGTLTLSPAFDPDTDTYTAATTNASNVINATPADAGASIVIKLGDVVKENGSALTWAAGSNTVTVTVTAADGTTTETYTITVTKS